MPCMIIHVIGEGSWQRPGNMPRAVGSVGYNIGRGRERHSMDEGRDTELSH